MNNITVQDYSTHWPLIFQAFKQVFKTHLGDRILDIQHIGSTAVPGLAAKPIIDIDLIFGEKDPLNPIIDILEHLGYEYRGDLGIKKREAFWPKSSDVPIDGSGRSWPPHNLYACLEGCASLQNHIQFRDYLRKNPEKAKQYGELKKKLAAVYPDDIDGYVENKTAFITGVLQELKFDQAVLADIAFQNKAKR